MTGPPALLFDLDGTLVDSAMGIATALSIQLQARGGGSIDVAKIRSLVSLGVERVVAGGLAALGGELDQDIDEFRSILASVSAEPSSVYDGVRPALDQLCACGHRLAVVTNKPEYLAQTLLRDLDLARFFQAVVGGDTLSVRKPDPAPLRHAVAAVGADSAVALIGDSGIDCAAAKAAGIGFWLFDQGYGATECDEADVARRFSHYDQLRGWFAG